MLKNYLFIFLFLPFSVLAQTVKISGVVFDQKKQAISWVSVSEIGNPRNTTYSNDDGSYEINLAVGDSVEISFSTIGYQIVDVLIPYLDEDIVLDVKLTGDDTMLDAVTVSGEKHLRTINMTMDVFDSKRRSYLLDSSIESLLSSFAGVSSTNELSSQYLVRGGNFDENIIYVNGVEIYRPLLIRTAQQEGLSFINPNMVSTVGFSTGGYNAEFGDKMSSVLDVRYKKPTRLEGSVGLGILENSAYLGNSDKRFSQMSSVRYKTTQSRLKSTDTKAEYMPTFWDFQTYMVYNITNKWEVNFLGNHSYNKYQFTPQTRSTSFGTLDNVRNFNVYFDGWENDKFSTLQGALTVKGKVSDKLELGITGSAVSSKEEEKYDIIGRYRLTENNIGGEEPSQTDNLIGVGTYHQHARNFLDVDIMRMNIFGSYQVDKNLLKFGFSIENHKIKDRIKEWEMRDSIGYSLPYDGDMVNVFSNLKSNNRLTSNRYSGFIQDKFQFASKAGLFNIIGGVRASYWDFNKEMLISPRLTFLLIPNFNDNFTFKVAGGIYYQAPFYKEYQRVVNVDGNNVIEPNKDIKSQKAIHYIIGGDYLFKSGKRSFKLTSELYYKQLENLIPYTVNNVKIRYSGVNEGDAYVTGMDMRLHGDFVEGTSNWVSVSLMQTQQNIKGVKTPLPTDQLYNIAVYLQDYFPGYERLKMNIKGSLTQGLPVSTPHSTLEDGYFRTPAYKRVDVGLTWELLGEDFDIRKRSSFYGAFKNIWLGLDIYNVFDIMNVNTYYWIADINNNQYAVPNYLTGRQFNIKLLIDF